MKIPLWILGFIGAFFIILVIIGLILSPGKTPPITDGQGNIVPSSIAEMGYVNLGGMDQFILIRGRDVANPVLLLLHGGPGTPQTHLFNRFNSELENHFVVVNWEQRGAGKSYHPDIPSESMTVGQLIEDTHELTLYLKERFGKEKIFLLGHSWGAYLGIRTAASYPEDYYAYIGVGQVVDQQESEAVSYRKVLNLAKAAGNKKAIRELETAGPPVDGHYPGGTKTLVKLRRWWREFGGACKNPDDLFSIFIKPLLLAKEYTLQDKLTYFAGEGFSVEHLLGPLMNCDLRREIPKLEVPIYLLHGRYDLQTVYELAEEYINQVKAPYKELITFENSAHLVPYEEADRFHNILINKVLQEALDD